MADTARLGFGTGYSCLVSYTWLCKYYCCIYVTDQRVFFSLWPKNSLCKDSSYTMLSSDFMYRSFHFLSHLCFLTFVSISFISLFFQILPHSSLLPPLITVFSFPLCYVDFNLLFFSPLLPPFAFLSLLFRQQWQWAIGSSPPSFICSLSPSLLSPPSLSIFLLQCSLKQAFCCLMTWIGGDCWEEIDL